MVTFAMCIRLTGFSHPNANAATMSQHQRQLKASTPNEISFITADDWDSALYVS